MSGRRPTLRRRLRRALGARHRLLDAVAEAALDEGVGAWLVGGPVRDLLLGREIGDLDVLLSNRLAPVARRVSRALGGDCVVRDRFLTATVVTPGGAPDLRVDLARARSEHYARPGALPRVTPATVEEDLQRRDFAIHALALPLCATAGRALLDPVGGRADLERGRIRILHAQSFLDDPTRLLRAARYAARLRFRIEPSTARALADAVGKGALDSVSGPRIEHEIDRLLGEDEPARIARETERCGLFGAIARGWRLDRRTPRGLRRLAGAGLDPEDGLRREAGLRLLLLGVAGRARTEILARLGRTGRRAHDVDADLRAFGRLQRALERPITPGKLEQRLAATGAALRLALWCVGNDAVARHIELYRDDLSRRPDPIDGYAARALGLRGPAVGRLLADARRRSLDGLPVDDAWLERRAARLRQVER